MSNKHRDLITTFLSVNAVTRNLEQADRDMVQRLLESYCHKVPDADKLTKLILTAQGIFKSPKSFEKDFAKLSIIALEMMLE